MPWGSAKLEFLTMVVVSINLDVMRMSRKWPADSRQFLVMPCRW
jgi:hypothetical protein